MTRVYLAQVIGSTSQAIVVESCMAKSQRLIWSRRLRIKRVKLGSNYRLWSISRRFLPILLDSIQRENNGQSRRWIFNTSWTETMIWPPVFVAVFFLNENPLCRTGLEFEKDPCENKLWVLYFFTQLCRGMHPVGCRGPGAGGPGAENQNLEN